MVGSAGQRGGTLELITAVSTVVVTVAYVDGGQALAVGTHELPAGAGFGIWSTNRKNKKNVRKMLEQQMRAASSASNKQGCCIYLQYEAALNLTIRKMHVKDVS